MIKFYYKIWVDTIIRIKSQPKNNENWKLLSMVYISMAMALNLIIIMAVLQRNILNKSFYNLNIDFFAGKKLDALVEFFVLFLIPMLAFNYFCIFYKEKYKVLIEKYPYYNGKLGLTYLLVSYFSPFTLIILAYIIEIFR